MIYIVFGLISTLPRTVSSKRGGGLLQGSQPGFEKCKTPKNQNDKMLDLECKERPRESDGAVGEMRGGSSHLQNQPGNGVRRVDVEEGFYTAVQPH